MSTFTLIEVPGQNEGLRVALHAAGLPTDDIKDDGRTFFRAVSEAGHTIGYAGIERCAGDVLLRSVVVLPEHRSEGLGRALVREILQRVDCSSDVFLATTSAAPFFSTLGFTEVPRTNVPAAVLATRQLASICPSSATIMRFNRPPPNADNDHH